MKQIVDKDVKKRKFDNKFIIYILLFILCFVICLLFASRVIEQKNKIPINYEQHGDIDYKVYLNPNDFYTENYLEMNKSYVASLINYIDISFNYKFDIDKKTNMDFDYKIICELVIENSKGKGKYLEKEYILLDNKIKKMIDDNELNIQENIKVDYNFYNQLANSFKSIYGVDINSYLNVYMVINSKNNIIDENNKILLTIPLSEKAIEINLDTSKQNAVKQIIVKGDVVYNYKYLVLEIAFFIPSCILLLAIIKKIVTVLNIHTAYDKYINKTLKEYDRLIVETKTKFNKRDYHVIDVKDFLELLDAYDNLNLPIIYLNTIPHNEGIFYIINNKDAYLLTVNDEYINRKKDRNKI